MQVRRIVNVLAVGILAIGTTTACATKKFVRTEVGGGRSTPASRHCRSRFEKHPGTDPSEQRADQTGGCEGRPGWHLGEGSADLGHHRQLRRQQRQLRRRRGVRESGSG